MKCHACNGSYVEHKGTLSLNNEIIGNYNINSVKFYKCDKCDRLLLPNDTIEIVEKREKEIQNQLIGQLPVGEFVIASKAAEILGISKQAFHKNRRIKKGFIYSITLGDKKLYNKQSVNLFKKNGDGRFKLSKQMSNENKHFHFHEFHSIINDLYAITPSREYQENGCWMTKEVNDSFSKMYPWKTKKVNENLKYN